MIRPATPADLAACLAIGEAAFTLEEDKPQAAWIVEVLSRPGAALTVAVGSQLLWGFLLTYPSRGRTLVAMVAVDPALRRQGVARSLLSTVAAPGCTWIRIDNEASQALFRSCGWVRCCDGDDWDWWELTAQRDTQKGVA